MAQTRTKIVVFDEQEETRVPFLRGILTRSLQDAGLSFEEAYSLASELRDRLSSEPEIANSELRIRAVNLLKERGFPAIAEHYETPRNERVSVHVRSSSGDLTPFSKNVLVQSLEISAEHRDTLYAVAAAVERKLLADGDPEIDARALTEMTYGFLTDAVGPKVSRRYLRWREFRNTSLPLILVIGGVTGTGKSTISSLVAHRLGIIRTQSTDMIREVMRRMVPKRLIPSLHESSFLAHRTLPRWEHQDGTKAAPKMVDGYLMQAAEVAVGIEGVFRRAVREQVSLMIEGVHVHPKVQLSLAGRKDALVVPLMLATMKRKALERQLQGRGQAVESRRAERYLNNLDAIWELQNFLLSEADHYDIPIITEQEPDEMVRKVMRVIAERLRRDFDGDPDTLFPASDSSEEAAGDSPLTTSTAD